MSNTASPLPPTSQPGDSASVAGLQGVVAGVDSALQRGAGTLGTDARGLGTDARRISSSAPEVHAAGAVLPGHDAVTAGAKVTQDAGSTAGAASVRGVAFGTSASATPLDVQPAGQPAGQVPNPVSSSGVGIAGVGLSSVAAMGLGGLVAGTMSNDMSAGFPVSALASAPVSSMASFAVNPVVSSHGGVQATSLMPLMPNAVSGPGHVVIAPGAFVAPAGLPVTVPAPVSVPGKIWSGGRLLAGPVSAGIPGPGCESGAVPIAPNIPAGSVLPKGGSQPGSVPTAIAPIAKPIRKGAVSRRPSARPRVGSAGGLMQSGAAQGRSRASGRSGASGGSRGAAAQRGPVEVAVKPPAHPYLMMWVGRDQSDPYEPFFVTDDDAYHKRATRSYVIPNDTENVSRMHHSRLMKYPGRTIPDTYWEAPDIFGPTSLQDGEAIVHPRKRARPATDVCDVGGGTADEAYSGEEVRNEDGSREIVADEHYLASVKAAAKYNQSLASERQAVSRWYAEEATHGRRKKESNAGNDDSSSDGE